MKTKVEVRKEILLKRKKLSLEEKLFKDLVIINKLMNFIKSNNFVFIGVYFPMDGEVNIIDLINILLDDKKISVCFPKISSDKKSIEFYVVHSLLYEVELNSIYNFFEPIDGLDLVKPNQLQCLIIPLVAFNRNFYRLGYGQGYYDRYLMNYNGVKLGVAYKFQEVNDFFVDSFDIRLSDVITD